jgi:hypothetical protein
MRIPLLDSPAMKTSRAMAPVLLALLAACSRPAPSPDYLAAREKHAAVLAAHPDDAPIQSEIDEVLALLERVPEGSLDAPAARELRERILAERKAWQERALERATLVDRAGETPAWPSATSIGRPATAPPIRPGMSLEELRALHGDCLERQAGEFRVAGADGKDRPVEAWGVSAAAECRERYAAHVESRVLVADGAVVAVRPAPEATPVPAETVVERRVEREVELVPVQGGGWGVRRADGSVEPLPAGAQVRTADGAPLPAPAEARP